MARTFSTPADDETRNSALTGTTLAVPSLLGAWSFPRLTP